MDRPSVSLLLNAMGVSALQRRYGTAQTNVMLERLVTTLTDVLMATEREVFLVDKLCKVLPASSTREALASKRQLLAEAVIELRSIVWETGLISPAPLGQVEGRPARPGDT